MPVGERVDPYAQFNFIVEIDDAEVAGFTEVTGLSAESDVIEYREGHEPATVRKLPGLFKFTNITLRRGYTESVVLWDWRRTTLEGKTVRRDGSIVLLDEEHKEVMRWNFREGWIAKYDGPALNSTTAEAAVESIEIAHEGISLGG
jgi:phage tail-like protein